MAASSSLPDLPPNYLKALELINEAHKQDPRPSTAAAAASASDADPVTFELHYARKMTRWLAVRCPTAPPVLQLACRAQHFRRWEIPRNTYPMTRPGYLTWRAKLKSQAAAQVAELLSTSAEIQPALPREDVDRVAALIRKENLSKDEETQVLEDVACLVFLDDQFDDFESKEDIDEAKIIGILQKTWAKMSEPGRQIALKMNHSERALSLIDDIWLVINDHVWDFTDFIREHPGGIAVILKCAGKDATDVYSEVHGPNLVKSTLPAAHLKGVLAAGANMPKPKQSQYFQPSTATSPTQDEQPRTPPQASSKPPLDTLISAHDFEEAASTSLSPKAWAFVSSAATDLHTKRRNASAYSLIGLRPRVLVDVSEVDTSTTMLGHRMRSPIFCSPTAMARLVHPEGEKELGRACKAAGIPQTVSVSASFPLADILAARAAHNTPENPHDPPVFFQLYVDKNRANSERLIRSAQAQGVKALFLTIDAPIPGKREADERVRSDESIASPISGARAGNDAKGGAIGRIMGNYIDASVSWPDVAWLRRTVPGLPIVLKGVQTWMDAERAADAGVEAVVLSNHGGRSLDTSPATVAVLLELQKNCPHVFDKLEVYVDGGVSRGTDIFKALCLGAKAVGVGRGLLYGLNYGVEGVERYVEILRDELETTMKMCGVTSLDQVHPGFLNTLAIDQFIPGREDNPNTPWRRDRHSRL
ncbi:FMN-dependent dehydrogenase [Colletotrichum karsti]|uniref:L-lactate dehydrogenase (cytochrome) n=1 Tax=Colletotrichum karsti TaxID=1095194 RepID=A0A9P6IF38_9PEZI|nr:FMN-dependent dehydrogenase [Colletotrichum karsti]KAF9881274.1 FMN-dependent dehydrogenase [Colletotrichum karsti]